MRCPHCRSDVESPVTETRDHEGSIWRRRRCSACSGSYVTVEASPEGLVMPAEIWANRRRQKAQEVDAMAKFWGPRSSSPSPGTSPNPRPSD